MNYKKKVCFACFTPTNVVMSYLLAKTIYHNYHKTLILSDWNLKGIYDEIWKNCSIWDQVLLIHEAGKKDRQQRFEEIKLQLSKINFQELDVVLYFQLNQHSYLNILFQYLADKTKLIVPAFTVSTHYLKEYYQYLKEYYDRRNVDIHIDFHRVSEIWSYNKKLYIGKLENTTIRDLKITDLLKNREHLKEYCEELNLIFNYTHQPLQYDLIFLEQPLKRFFEEEAQEKELLSKIFDAFQGHKILIKLHPSVNTALNKYDILNVDVMKQNRVPWEIIFMNELLHDNLKNKIFASYFSETIYTTHAFLYELDIPHKAIKLQGILQNYKTANLEIGDYITNEFGKRFMELYKDFQDIKTLEALSQIVGLY